MALPESRGQAALNQQMVQVQLDDFGVFGKIALDIFRAHFDACKFASFAMRLD
jgi:hypothetical protein